ncbi:hypothetical protein BFD52_11395 [Escherichia coli]|nr:hypothetical protein BFD52_11395 [Escherichia coli]
MTARRFRRAFLCTENPQLGWGFRKAFSFKPVIKTPFDLLKHLAVWQLQVSNPAYGPQNDVTLKMPAFEWVHVQLHQQKGMISLSPPTICNSAAFFNPL